MDVDIRKILFHGSGEIDVEVAVEVGRQAGLHANFGCAHLHRFLNPAKDFLDRQEISLFAAVAPAEGTKPAVLYTYVREVHITVDNVCNDVPHLAPPQFVSGHDSRVKLASAGLTQPEAILPGDLLAFQGTRQDRVNCWVNRVE